MVNCTTLKSQVSIHAYTTKTLILQTALTHKIFVFQIWLSIRTIHLLTSSAEHMFHCALWYDVLTVDAPELLWQHSYMYCLIHIVPTGYIHYCSIEELLFDKCD